MSIVYTELTLKNMADVVDARRERITEDEVRQITVESIVDTGAWTIVINEETRKKRSIQWQVRWKSGGKTATWSVRRW